MAKTKAKTKSKLTLKQQAEEILKMAEEKGVNTNFFFVTTFKRYQVQMEILISLEKGINEHGPLVTKEYVKGRQNVVVNPAITEYNKTSTACNGTLSTLLNVLKSFENEGSDDGSKLKELFNQFS
jgi:predicted secreted Zn-dependent protease